MSLGSGRALLVTLGLMASFNRLEVRCCEHFGGIRSSLENMGKPTDSRAAPRMRFPPH